MTVIIDLTMGQYGDDAMSDINDNFDNLNTDKLETSAYTNATTSAAGKTRLSTSPVDVAIPIAVGDNDPRVPTTGENDALVGNNTDVAVGTGNKFVTQTGLQHNSEKYAADAGANDTYVITLSPVPTSYTNGMVVYFKANTVNTGAATINVNSLGAKTIVKGVNTTLEDGDIAASQFCDLIYDGTNFVLLNPAGLVSTFKNGVTTRTADTASGTQTIAHGGGRVPKFVELSANFSNASSGTVSHTAKSEGCYNGTTNSCVYEAYTLGNGAGSNALTTGNSSTQGIYIQQSGTAGNTQVGVITFDATNITITWTKTGTLAANAINILWKAQF